MANNVPLYTGSREYARAHDELPLWRESISENIRCKQAIEDAIRQGFDGLHLKPDCAESVIQEFSFDRVEYVLGNTLHQLSYDEIAQVLKLDVGTVKSRINRGRKQLRNFLLKSGNFSPLPASKGTEKEG